MGLFAIQGIQTSFSLTAFASTSASIGENAATSFPALENPHSSATLRQIEYRNASSFERERIDRIRAWVKQNGGSIPMSKILINNRGDPALRMIREVQEFNHAYGLDIRTAVVFPDSDDGEAYVRQADEAIPLDFDKPVDTFTYQDGAVVTEVGRRIKASHVFPGWGFLAERDTFADRVKDAGMTFVGPTPDQIRIMGHKHSGLEQAARFDLPVGLYSEVFYLSASDSKNAGKVEAIAQKALEMTRQHLDFPNKTVMIKDCHGGGGTGNRKIDAIKEGRDIHKAESDFLSAMKIFLEAGKAVFIEEFAGGEGIEVQHIEFQVLGDGQGRAVCIGWRQCSLQRRDQKVFEMTHTNVPLELLDEIQGNIVNLMKDIKWRGPGTFEFLIAKDTREENPAKQYRAKFMEMNTRLQVEHGITEESYGINIVHEMLRVAMGMPLSVEQKDIRQRSVTIEMRLLAEDEKFNPQAGPIHAFQEASGQGVRTDAAVAPGSNVSDAFDSMIARKMFSVPLPSHDASDLSARRKALDEAYRLCVGKLRRGLREVKAGPIKTNKYIGLAFAEKEEFAKGDFHLGSFSHFAEEYKAKSVEKFDAALASAAIKAYIHHLKELRTKLLSRTRILTDAELIPMEGAQFNVRWRDQLFRIQVAEVLPGMLELEYDGKRLPVKFEHVSDFSYSITIDGQPFDIFLHYDETEIGIDVTIDVGAVSHEFSISREAIRIDRDLVGSPVTGKMWLNHVKSENYSPGDEQSTERSLKYADRDIHIGDHVKEGQILGVVESMKMEIPVYAPFAGTVVWVNEQYAHLKGVSDEKDKTALLGISEGTPLYRIKPDKDEVEEKTDAVEIPYARHHPSSLLEQLRSGSIEDEDEVLEDLFRNIEVCLPRILADIRYYFLGYDYPENYIQNITQFLLRVSQRERRFIRNFEEEIHGILRIHWDFEKVRGPEMGGFYYSFLKGISREQYPVDNEEFESHIIRLLNYHDMDIDRNMLDWRKIDKGWLGTVLLRIRLANRRRAMRRAMMERVIEAAMPFRTRKISDALYDIIELEKKNVLDNYLRIKAETSLRVVDVDRYQGLHRPVVSPKYSDRLGLLRQDPAIGIPNDELRRMRLYLDGKGHEDDLSELPEMVENTANRYAAREGVTLKRIYTPLTQTFAFVVTREPTKEQIKAAAASKEVARAARDEAKKAQEIADQKVANAQEFPKDLEAARAAEEAKSKAESRRQKNVEMEEAYHKAAEDAKPKHSYLVIAYNEGEATIEMNVQGEVVGVPDLQYVGINAAITMHLLQREQPLKTRGHIYIVQNPQYPVPYDATGSKRGEINFDVVRDVGRNIFAFFHGANLAYTAVVLPSSSDDTRVFTYQVTTTGLHPQVESLDKHFGEHDPKTARQKARGLMTPDELAVNFFGMGQFKEIEYPDVTGGKPVGVRVYEGMVDGLPVMTFANDFRVIGGAFGAEVGRILARVKFESYMRGVPVIGLMDGAGANIKQGLISLNYSAIDFMFNVITSGDAGNEMFARWLINHPDRQTIEELMVEYGPASSKDGVLLKSDKRFQDIVKKVINYNFAMAIQHGVGVGMVVYGSSLLAIQTMLNHHETNRMLTGKRVREMALGEAVSDYEVAGALVHATKSGEVSVIFDTIQDMLAHARKTVRLFHPQRRDPIAALARLREMRKNQKKGVVETNGILSEEDLSALLDEGSFDPQKKLLRGGEGVTTGFGSLAGLPIAILGPTTDVGFGTYEAIFKAHELMRAAEILRIPVIRITHDYWVDRSATEEGRAVVTRQILRRFMGQMTVPQFSIATGYSATLNDGAHFSSDVKFFVNSENIPERDLERIKRCNYTVVGSVEEAIQEIAELLPFFLPSSEGVRRHLLKEDPADRPTLDAAEVIPEAMDQEYDVNVVLRDIADSSLFREIWGDMNHPTRGPSLVTGFAFIGGKPRFVIADQPNIRAGTPDHVGAEKDERAAILAERLGLTTFRWNDAPGFDPQQAEEAANIQGAGAKSIKANIKSRLAKVRVNGRKGYGGRWIQADHPFLRPGTKEFIIKGSEVAVMGPAASVAALDQRRLVAGERVLDIVEEKRSQGYGDPQLAIDTGVAEAIIRKDEIRAQVISAFEEAEREAELAYRKPHNTMSVEDLNLAGAMQRLEVLGFIVRAAVGTSDYVVEVRDPNQADWRATFRPEEVLSLLHVHPDADRQELAHLMVNHPSAQSRIGVARARQNISSLLTSLGIANRIEEDRLLIKGAEYYFGKPMDLFGYLMGGRRLLLDRLTGHIDEGFLRPEMELPPIDTEKPTVNQFVAVDSTNSLAQEFARRKAASGTVIVADEQTAGRGQLDRHWISPRGGLWMSGIYREKFDAKQDIPRVNIAVALAVRELLEEEFGLEARVAWPNDVVVKEQKIAGILNEPISQGEGLVVGIGININNEVPKNVRKPATSVKRETGHEVERDPLILKLKEKLNRYLTMKSDDIRAIYNRKAAWPQGRRVVARRIVEEDGEERVESLVKGEVVGVDFENGHFVIQGDDGKRINLEGGLYRIQSKRDS